MMCIPSSSRQCTPVLSAWTSVIYAVERFGTNRVRLSSGRTPPASHATIRANRVREWLRPRLRVPRDRCKHVPDAAFCSAAVKLSPAKLQRFRRQEDKVAKSCARCVQNASTRFTKSREVHRIHDVGSVTPVRYVICYIASLVQHHFFGAQHIISLIQTADTDDVASAIPFSSRRLMFTFAPLAPMIKITIRIQVL